MNSSIPTRKICLSVTVDLREGDGRGEVSLLVLGGPCSPGVAYFEIAIALTEKQ